MTTTRKKVPSDDEDYRRAYHSIRKSLLTPEEKAEHRKNVNATAKYHSDNVTETYIKRRLYRSTGIQPKDIILTSDEIERYRQHLITKRLICKH
jgi:hypothetical protein